MKLLEIILNQTLRLHQISIKRSLTGNTLQAKARPASRSVSEIFAALIFPVS